MRIKLPEPYFNLPEWKQAHFSGVGLAAKELETLAKKVGKTSGRFQEICEQLRKWARLGMKENLSDVIVSPMHVRAITYLLSTEKAFFLIVPMTENLLSSLLWPRKFLSRLSLLQLISAFLSYFDEINQKGNLHKVCYFLRSELSKHEEERGTDLGRLARYRNLIFDIDGPSHVVRTARERSVDLDGIFRETGLNGSPPGRFHEICRFHYYLETLRHIPVGEDHAVLAEVTKPVVFNSPAGNNRLIGHEVLSILIDRSGREISDFWRNVVLTIAGDPRIPPGHPRYQRWWALLGEERIRKMRGWLSRFDLLLFLDILEEYGRSSGMHDLQRMFPARKIFLEGLYKQNLIQQSRLFVSNQAEQYLIRRYRREELPEYARVNDSYRSVIYLQVGNCHVIEGSHSFKLWFFPRLPSSSGIADYTRNHFSPSALGMDLEKAYKREYGAFGDQPASIRHHPPLGWQAEAIKQLKKRGIRLDVEGLFSRSDYRDFLRRYGL